MNSMVENIARALCRARYNGPPEMYPKGWVDERVNANWHIFVPDAKTVLTAMRDPTDKMICAALDDWDRRKGDQTDRHVRQAMIDEALK